MNSFTAIPAHVLAAATTAPLGAAAQPTLLGMPWEGWAMAGIVVLVLYALARNLAKPDLILMGAFALALTFGAIFGPGDHAEGKPASPAGISAPHFPSPEEMARVFGNEALFTVGVLFVVAKGLSTTGAVGMLTRHLLGRPKNASQALARMLLPVTITAAFLHPTTTVAIFVPVISEWGKKANVALSKLLIPLSYAAIFGGTTTLIGCSTNLIVQGLLLQAGKDHAFVHPMAFLTISWVGVPAAICGMLYLLGAGRWLLPDRTPPIAHLADPREYTVEMMVEAGSAIDGQTIEQAGLRNLPGAYLMEIDRGGESLVAVGPAEILRGNDRLIFAGVVDSVRDLQKNRGLIPATDQVFKLQGSRSKRELVEAVVSSTCPLVGKSVREGRFRTVYDAALIAVHRNGERIRGKIGDIVLKPGDTLLLETRAGFAEKHRDSRDFFLVSAVADSSPPHFEKAWWSLAILAGMVVVVIFNLMNLMNAALIAAGLMVVTRCLTAEQARKSIDWSILIAIGSSFGVGKAMETTGLAASVAAGMLNLFHGWGPTGVLLGIYLMTLIFTHFVTHNAGAVIVFPIALEVAVRMGAHSFMPFAIVLAMAASNAYATPLGYATHLMVYGPGGYRFSDFVRAGVPLDILIMLVTIILTPMFFPMF